MDIGGGYTNFRFDLLLDLLLRLDRESVPFPTFGPYSNAFCARIRPSDTKEIENGNRAVIGVSSGIMHHGT